MLAIQDTAQNNIQKVQPNELTISNVQSLGKDVEKTLKEDTQTEIDRWHSNDVEDNSTLEY